MIETISSDGTVTTSQYDGVGNRIAATDALGNITLLLYDLMNRQVEVVNPDNTASFVQYAANGRPALEIDANGNATGNTFDVAGRLVSITNALGAVVRDVYDGFDNVLSTAYYASASSVTPYNATTFQFDLRNRVIEVQGAEGAFSTQTYDANGNVIQSVRYDVAGYTYDPVGYTPGLTDSLGQSVALSSLPASRQRVTATTYDVMNRPTQVSEPILAGASTPLTTLTSYDLAGRVLTTTDERGLSTSYGYDVDGRRISVTQPNPNDLSQPGVTTTFVLDADGNLVSSTDPLGRTTTNTYDLRSNRVIAVTLTDLAGTLAAPDSTYTSFDGNGNVVATTDALGNRTIHLFDNRNRVVETLQPAPGGAEGQAQPATQYQYDPVGDPIAVTDPLGRVTYTVFDALNRVVTQSVADSPSGAYNAQTLSVSGPVSGWTTVNASAAFGGTELQHAPGDGSASAGLDFKGLQSGLYRIMLTWVPDSSNATDAPVSIYDGQSLIGSAFLNERIAPTGPSVSGATFQQLNGLFEVTNGELNVLISDGGTGNVVINAVHIEYVPAGTFAYDANGNLSASSDPLQHVTTFQYDHARRQILVTAPDPDGNGPLSAASTAFSYDSFSNIIAKTFEPTSVTGSPLNLVTTYAFDSLEREVTEIDPAPDSSHPNLALETDKQYDGDGNVTQISVHPIDNSSDQVTTFTYDYLQHKVSETDPNPLNGAASGPKTTWTVDVLGNILSITDPIGNAGPASQIDLHTTRFTYNALNQKLSESDPSPDGIVAGPITRFSYDAFGDLLLIRDAQGNVTSFLYDGVHRKIQETDPDPDGVGPLPAPVTLFGYDPVGNLLSQTSLVTFNGVSQSRTTTYVFNLQDRRIAQTLPNPTDGTPTGPSTTWTWDVAGNMLSMTDPLGRVTYFGYDALNRRVSQSVPTTTAVWNGTTMVYDAYGNVISTTDPLGRTTIYTYDNLHHKTSETQPDPGVVGENAPQTRYAFDAFGNEISSTVVFANPSLNATTVNQYDDLNRLIATINPVNAKTSYTYDLNGNQVTVTDADLNTTTSTYDGLNRLIATTNAFGTVTNIYDSLSRLIETVDADGRAIVYGYDHLGRKISETWYATAALGTPIDQMIWVYDGAGQLVSESDSNGATSFTRDALGRVVTQTVTNIGLPTVVYSFRYDSDNNVYEQDTAVAGSTIQTIYDEFDTQNNLVLQAVWSTNPSTAVFQQVNYTVDLDGEVTAISRYQGSASNQVLVATTTTIYDGDGRVESIVDQQGTVILDSYVYSYDDASRVSSVTSYLDGTNAYSYDNAGQIATATYSAYPSANENHSFDATGNSTANTTGSDNRLTSDSTFTYTYNNSGDEISRIRISSATASDYVTLYTWDNRNRLIQVITENNQLAITKTVTYTYDVENRRLSETVSVSGGTTTVTFFSYANDNNVAVTLNGSGVVTSSELYVQAGQVISQVDSSNTVRWMLADSLNSVRDVVALNGSLAQVVDNLSYNSFGAVLNETSLTTPHLFGYAGQQTDTAINLNFDQARYYDPVAARFISQDPTGFNAGDTNLFRYVANNPVNFADPTGLHILISAPQQSSGESAFGTVSIGEPVGNLGSDDSNSSNSSSYGPIQGAITGSSNSGSSAASIGTSSYVTAAGSSLQSNTMTQVDASSWSTSDNGGSIGYCDPSNPLGPPSFQGFGIPAVDRVLGESAGFLSNAVSSTVNLVYSSPELAYGAFHGTCVAIDTALLSIYGQTGFPGSSDASAAGAVGLQSVQNGINSAVQSGEFWLADTLIKQIRLDTAMDKGGDVFNAAYNYGGQFGKLAPALAGPEFLGEDAGLVIEQTSAAESSGAVVAAESGSAVSVPRTFRLPTSSAAASRIPMGFEDAGEFQAFGRQLHGGLADAGFGEAQGIMQGSSVTGQSFRTGVAFDVGRISDFDVAIADPAILARAEELGIGLRSGGIRTGPLSPYHLDQLGLTDLSSQLASQAGREVNFMVYRSVEAAMQRSPSIIIPR